MKVAIVTDSTCDLGFELLKEYNIYSVPLYVNFKDKSYKDGLDLNTKELYDIVEKEGVLPKTSATTPLDFEVLFKKLFEEYDEIFYTGISSAMSSTMQNARVASISLEKEDKVFIMDSKNLSTGIGLLLLKACKFRDLGLSGKEIVERVKSIVPNVRSQFAIETMTYLYKGGRCNSLEHFFGKMFKIKPIIVVRDGKMSVGKKPHGKMVKALDALVDYVKSDINNIDLDRIFITHSEALESVEYLKKELSSIVPNVPVYITEAGCVISSHCGSGTIGILYIKNEVSDEGNA